MTLNHVIITNVNTNIICTVHNDIALKCKTHTVGRHNDDVRCTVHGMLNMLLVVWCMWCAPIYTTLIIRQHNGVSSSRLLVNYLLVVQCNNCEDITECLYNCVTMQKCNLKVYIILQHF